MPSGEANIAHDPDAAAVVAAAGWRTPPLLVGLDVTHRATLTRSEFDLVAEHRTPAAAFLDEPLALVSAAQRHVLRARRVPVPRPPGGDGRGSPGVGARSGAPDGGAGRSRSVLGHDGGRPASAVLRAGGSTAPPKPGRPDSNRGRSASKSTWPGFGPKSAPCSVIRSRPGGSAGRQPHRPVRLVRSDLGCVRERDADVVETFEEPVLGRGSMGNGATRPLAGASTIRRCMSTVISRLGSASMASCSCCTVGSGSTTGTRPFLVQLLRKMSEKRGEITASNP